jgi:hypothetical protein
MINRTNSFSLSMLGLSALLSMTPLTDALAASSAGGEFALSASTYTVSQTGGSVTVTVKRTDGASGAASVRYHTVYGTALDGISYDNTYGVLSWASGDTSPKTFSIPILDKEHSTKTRSFTIELSKTTNATLATPASAIINIVSQAEGGGPTTPPPVIPPPVNPPPVNPPPTSGTGKPGVPGNLLVSAQSTDGISLSWSAASAGDYPVDHYQIYRNGSAYTTTTGTRFTDNGATNATNGAYTSAATIYSYAIEAVDSQGNAGAQTEQSTFNVFTNGVFSWEGDYSYSASANYRDTSGGPENGPYDIEISVWSQGGGFQPYAGNVVPTYDLEAGSFGYISMDLKPTINGQTWRLSAISRLPPGDVYPWAATSITEYGPAPQVGKWATYKIPLSALSIGKTSFTGSISGTTLTVTSVNGGVGVDAGGFISGNGVAPGTYITGYNAKGGTGTYTVHPAQNVANTSMEEQRTAVYKIDVIDESGASSNHYYVDNLKFSKD